MTDAQRDTEGALVAAVTELTGVVRDVQAMLRKDYPSREEIERDFVSKFGIKKRRRTYAIIGVVAILSSYFWAMGTVSYCFLQGQGTVNEIRPYCRILPGYTDVVDYSQKRLAIYEKSLQTIIEHEQRLDQIEDQQKGQTTP